MGKEQCAAEDGEGGRGAAETMQSVLQRFLLDAGSSDE